MKNTEEEEKQVKDTISRVYRAFESLDTEKLDENFSHTEELLAFGTDWDERFAGWNAYKDVHTVQFKVLKSFKFVSRELAVHVHDGTAWISDRPHWEIETKDGEHVQNDVRITAVLKKNTTSSGSPWLIVQWHVSVGLRERLHEY